MLLRLQSNVRLSDVDVAARTALLTWAPVPLAESYVVEYGNGATQAGRQRVVTNGTAITLRELVVDEPSVALVQTRNAGGESPFSAPVSYRIPDIRDVTEALIFGTGPHGTGFFMTERESDFILVGPNAAHASAGRMIGWPSPTGLRLRAPRALSSQQLQAVSNSVDQINELTFGAVSANLAEVSDQIREEYRSDELAIVVKDDLAVVCNNANAGGCASMATRPSERTHFFGGILFVKPTLPASAVSHEIWHGMGLHHISTVWPGLPRPTMNPSGGGIDILRLTPMEADAVRRVYEAGLRPAASRSDFHGRGLIKNP